nr:hypothetical protein [Tanacetum cinerariifolium]
MRGVKRSVSSHTYGWDKSSSMLDHCFFGHDFQCPPALPLLSESTFVLREDVLLLWCFSGTSSVPLEREIWPLFLGDSNRPRLGSGLSDTLRIRLDPSVFLRSLLLLGVLESECCETSSKLRRVFTALSFSCCSFSWCIFSPRIGNNWL